MSDQSITCLGDGVCTNPRCPDHGLTSSEQNNSKRVRWAEREVERLEQVVRRRRRKVDGESDEFVKPRREARLTRAERAAGRARDRLERLRSGS